MHEQHELPLNDVLILAHEAKAHAKSIIKKGNTWTEKNTYPSTPDFPEMQKLYEKALYEAVDLQRELFDDRREEKNFYDPLENDPNLVLYEAVISESAKSSLGNCGELAFHALDYILYHAPLSMRAEIYQIEGNDHYFLVLNRKRERESTDTNPLSWGNDAVICDPWADEVYQAKDYISKFTKAEFNPEKQKLVPVKGLNTDLLREIRTIEMLKSNFEKFSSDFPKALQQCIMNLTEELDELGETSDEYKLITNNIELIKTQIELIETTIKHLLNKEYKDYRFARYDFKEFIDVFTQNIRQTAYFASNKKLNFLSFEEYVYQPAPKVSKEEQESVGGFSRVRTFFNKDSKQESTVATRSIKNPDASRTNKK